MLVYALCVGLALCVYAEMPCACGRCECGSLCTRSCRTSFKGSFLLIPSLNTPIHTLVNLIMSEAASDPLASLALPDEILAVLAEVCFGSRGLFCRSSNTVDLFCRSSNTIDYFAARDRPLRIVGKSRAQVHRFIGFFYGTSPDPC